MAEKVLGVCPHAVKINPGFIGYGCGTRANRLGTGSGHTVYCPPCTKECAEGEYEKCPWFHDR